MPRVALTAEQREAYRRADRAKALADKVVVHKALKRTTYQEMGECVGLTRQTVRRIANGQDVCVPVSALLKLLELVGQ